MERRVILASGSPRRRELINQIGWKPEVIPSTVEEKTEETLPDKVVESLSFQKAKDVAARLLKGELEPGCLIVGADTVVAAGGKILGKPKDRKDAAEMLSAIQGDVHQVYTGVTVMVYRGKQKEGEAFAIRTFSERTDVWVYPMTEKEIQDYIDDWEPDDEDDELDDEALWAPVLTITAGFQKDGRFRVPAVRDKKKMNVLEAVSRLSGTDLLSLCVPAGTVISENWISTAAFPSALYAGGESGKRGTAGDVWTAGLERALLDAYAAHFFTRFGQEKTGSVHYEQEYLLQGNASERENLKHTVNELLAVREAVNLAALYADSEKRSEAEALALAITGLAGITPITAAASFFIMTVWAFAESVADVKVLLAGGKIPFFKQPGEWQISLSALTEKGASIFLETGTDPSLKNGTDDSGLDYQDWLKLFFLIQGKSRFCYRMMDMIQNRISEKEPGFRMDQCQYGVSVSYTAQGTLIPLRRTSQKEY